MISKYQKTSFNKEKLLKMKEFTTEDVNGHKQFVDYFNLKLTVISGQLCFVDPNDYFMPITRISTIKDIIEKENNNKEYFDFLTGKMRKIDKNNKESYENEED